MRWSFVELEAVCFLETLSWKLGESTYMQYSLANSNCLFEILSDSKGFGGPNILDANFAA